MAQATNRLSDAKPLKRRTVSINSTWWDANVVNGAWDPNRVFTATAPGKAAGGSVAVVARTPDHMDLFCVHPDVSINSTWWDANVAKRSMGPQPGVCRDRAWQGSRRVGGRESCRSVHGDLARQGVLCSIAGERSSLYAI
jgi:hypothetical protein